LHGDFDFGIKQKTSFAYPHVKTLAQEAILRLGH
jgi:hypothetical protein